MKSFSRKPLAWAAALAATTSLGALSVASPAFAGGNGATTEGQHLSGSATEGLVVLDFNPQDSPTLPAGCWADPSMVVYSTSGNAVEHDTVSKDGDEWWFTTTYTGDAAVYPADEVNISPDQNPSSLKPGATPLYVGHMTTWFGMNQNNRNANSTATASFHGTSPSGQNVNLNGSMHYTTNANGATTVVDQRATC
ncbi:MAG TPA: hypothetical protein VFH58_07810 [Acidimicrobiales bacterium]|nr:hypothetical protein [Acidimicrobiales bacterium]